MAIEACKGLWIVLKKVDRDTEPQEAEAGHIQGRDQDQGRGGEEVGAEVGRWKSALIGYASGGTGVV
jgi:hypothetical protein